MNISREGALVLFRGVSPAAIPGLGDALELRIELPKWSAYQPRCLWCNGSARRVSAAKPGGYSVAIRFDRLRFGKLQTPARRMTMETFGPPRKPMLM